MSQAYINVTTYEQCTYSEIFRSVFSWIRAESPYSVRMRENTGLKNSKYGHILRSLPCAFYTAF